MQMSLLGDAGDALAAVKTAGACHPPRRNACSPCIRHAARCSLHLLRGATSFFPRAGDEILAAMLEKDESCLPRRTAAAGLDALPRLQVCLPTPRVPNALHALAAAAVGTG